MTGELYKGIDYLEWGKLRSCGVAKEVDGGSIINGYIRGNVLTVHPVEKLNPICKRVPGSRCSVETF